MKCLKVKGVRCKGCEDSLVKSVSAVPGVSGVSVDRVEGVFCFEGGGGVEPAVRKAVENAGFRVVD